MKTVSIFAESNPEPIVAARLGGLQRDREKRTPPHVRAAGFFFSPNRYLGGGFSLHPGVEGGKLGCQVPCATQPQAHAPTPRSSSSDGGDRSVLSVLVDLQGHRWLPVDEFFLWG